MSFWKLSKYIARREHRCDQCGKPIEVGTQYIYCAYLSDGNFMTSHEHIECREAWLHLNFSDEQRELNGEDGIPFLRDDEFGFWEKESICKKYPIVAERLGWSNPNA